MPCAARVYPLSPTAVRFGRVPKKEKAKILEQMMRVNAQSQLNALDLTLESDPDFIRKIVSAHFRNCDFTRDKIQKLSEKAWAKPEYIHCPAHMVGSALDIFVECPKVRLTRTVAVVVDDDDDVHA